MSISEEEALIEYLESDQLVRHQAHPVDRLALSGPARTGLWVLRVLVVVLSVMVVYTFVAQL